MNLDLLQKLIRLANNNPNDNEANLAARRVCKMLAEAMTNGELNWKVKEPITTWNDVERTTEPEFKSQYKSNTADFYTIMEEMRRASEKRRQEQYKRDIGRGYDVYEKYYDPMSYGSPQWTKPKPPKEKRILTCTKCNVDKETVFVGHPSVFVCSDCIWTDYSEKWKGKPP